MIPKQLQRPEFRFVRIATKQKNPIDESWQKGNNFQYDSNTLADWLKLGGNYGVVGGFGNLLIIDFDDFNFQEKIVPLLPKTFTIKSGTGKFHKYFITDVEQPNSLKAKDDSNNTLADLQGEGKQVVGANSTHPNGNKYEVYDDVEIAKISYSEIVAIFYEYIPSLRKKNEKKSNGVNKFSDNDTDVMKIKSMLKVSNILQELGCDTKRNPTQCPLHESKGGKCLSYNDEKGLWKCFHCDEGGDIFTLYSLKKDLSFAAVLDYFCKRCNILRDESSLYLQLTSYKENTIKFWKKQPFFYNKQKMFWLWNKNEYRWEYVDETDMLLGIQHQLQLNGELIESGVKNCYIEAFKQVGRERTPRDAEKTWVQFKGLIVDFATGKTMAATPEYFCCNPIPWELGDYDTTPTFDKIFEEWVGKEYVDLLYEIIAYCCLMDYPIHRIFALEGSGSNGKSCFLEIVERFVGKENICVASLDAICNPNNRFETCKMYKKLVCRMGETNFNELRDTEKLKQISAGDTISFEFKNKDPFEAKSYAKVLMASNSFPATSDKTDGFYRRWLIVKFSKKFSEKKDILATIPLDEYNNLARKTVKILKKLLERREFTNEGTIEERKNKYEEVSNPISGFIKNNYKEDINSDVPFYQFYDDLVIYLSQRGKRAVSKIEVGRYLTAQGFDQKVLNKKVGSEFKTWKCILGLKEVSSVNDINVINNINTISHIENSIYFVNKANNVNNCVKIIEEQFNDCLDNYDKLIDKIKKLINKNPIEINNLYETKFKEYKQKEFDDAIKHLIKMGELFEPISGYLAKLE